MEKIDWRQPAVVEYLKFLEDQDKKKAMIILSLNPEYKTPIEDLEKGVVLKELCKIALKEP